jgi:flagellar hook-associated protein 2
MSSITDALNSRLRITGMSSGLDIDSMVKQLMKIESAKVDKAKQKRQKIEWQQEAYRDLSNSLRSFRDTFLDILSPKNMRSAANYQKYTTSYSDTNNTVTATGGAGVTNLTHSIAVTQVATAAIGTSSGTVSSDPNNKIGLYATIGDISSKLQAGSITFIPDPADTTGTNQIISFKINGTDIKVNKTDTLSALISKVNSSDAGVTLSYSSFLDKFTITSKQTGAGTINLDSNGSNFFEGIKLTNAEVTSGQDSAFILDGQSGTNSANSFVVDGVNYNLRNVSPSTTVGGVTTYTPTTVTLTQDTDAIYKSIKDFVDKYNDLMSNLNTKYTEKVNRNYQPLTDDQKSAMKDTEIKNWEDKAKSGLLHGDSIIGSSVDRMRRAVSDSIAGISGTLASIGISTGDYRENGKLIIDETKLRNAISNSPDKVKDIFSKESSIAYSPNSNATDKKIRYDNNGVLNRLYDIIQDDIRTTRDSNNHKGALLVKAGMIGDVSEFDNTLSKHLNEQDNAINTLIDRLSAKEEQYYKKFSAMETALNNMNSQSAWLSSQSGSN